ncbi:MAG: hypothetical protein ABI742_13135 [Gemmatimonadota bacterium]
MPHSKCVLLLASACLWIGSPLLFGCGSDPAAPRTTVEFVLDAPLCSSMLPVEFSIDSVLVGSDTFRVRLPPDDTISPSFATTPGSHSLGAHVINGLIWPDTTVTLAEGESFSLILPFYCS